MNFIELQEGLQNLIDKKISLSEIGRILNLSRSNISLRAKNKSEVSISELEQIQNHFGVRLYVRVDDNSIKVVTNSGERQNDTTVSDRVLRFGDRVCDLQDKHEFLDREMAQLLKISEKEYISLKLGKAEPNVAVLNRLKQCFKVSIDYLLYGG